MNSVEVYVIAGRATL